MLNPNASAALDHEIGADFSVPICAKAELHETRKMSKSDPPQLERLKLAMANSSSDVWRCIGPCGRRKPAPRA